MGDASVFLNDPRTRKALHAPTSKDWAMQFPFVFGDPNGEFLPSSIVNDILISMPWAAIDPSKLNTSLKKHRKILINTSYSQSIRC